MKKKLSILFACLIAALCVGCNEPPVPEKGDLNVYTLLATEKYMQDEEITFSQNDKISLFGIKNEIQSAQIMFNSSENINSFDLKVGNLVAEDGAVIDASNVNVYAERYIEVYLPFMQNPNYISMGGFYPDALVPLAKYKMRREDRVKANENQALWIDVSIPADAVAGEYFGEFTLVANDTEKSIEVSLKVYDLTMPEEVHSPSHFAIWYEQIAFGEGNNMDSQTYQRYYDYLLTKRLCSAKLTPAETKDANSFLAAIEKAAQNPKVTSYEIPLSAFGVQTGNDAKLRLCPEKPESSYTEADKKMIAETYNATYTKLLECFELILNRNLELRKVEGKETIDLFKKAFIYPEDEPPLASYRMRYLRVFNEIMTQAKKEILNKYATVFAENTDLMESFKSFYAICPSNYMDDALFVSKNEDGTPNYDKGDGLMFWCPEMYRFNDETFRNTALERLELGEKLWWYLCVSNSPRPSYYVESLPVNIRMQSWMQYDYSVAGILYWQICHFGGPVLETGSSVWEDLHYDGYGGGEGILVYPGERYGMKDPISSWRLEQIRLGQQDYELFYLLNSYLVASDSEITAREVISALGSTMYTGTTVDLENGTSQTLENARLTVLEILEKFQLGDNNGALTIINSIVK